MDTNEFNITFGESGYSGGAVIPTPGLLEEVNQRSSTSAAIARLEEKINALSSDKPADAKRMKIDYLDQKIIETVNKLRSIGASTSDEAVAARLPMNSRGRPYTREWINKRRNAMRRHGIDV